MEKPRQEESQEEKRAREILRCPSVTSLQMALISFMGLQIMFDVRNNSMFELRSLKVKANTPLPFQHYRARAGKDVQNTREIQNKVLSKTHTTHNY